MLRRILTIAVFVAGMFALSDCTPRYTNQPIIKVSKHTRKKFDPTRDVTVERKDVYFPKENEIEIAEMKITWNHKTTQSVATVGHVQDELMGDEFDELVQGFMVPRAMELGANVVVVTVARVERVYKDHDIESDYYVLGMLIKRN